MKNNLLEIKQRADMQDHLLESVYNTAKKFCIQEHVTNETIELATRYCVKKFFKKYDKLTGKTFPEMDDYAVVDGKIYHSEVMCPRCQHTIDVDMDEGNFIVIQGKTSDDSWDDIECPSCKQKFSVDFAGLSLFRTRKE